MPEPISDITWCYDEGITDVIQVFDGDGLAHVSAIRVDLEIASCEPNLQELWFDSGNTLDLHLNHDHPALEYLFRGAMFDEIEFTGTRGGAPWQSLVSGAVVTEMRDDKPLGKFLRLTFQGMSKGVL